MLLLSFFLSATEKAMAVARFFFFFCGREIKLILDSERERERERERASSSFSLGFCSRKEVLHPARIRKIDVLILCVCFG
jgi:hypothetical protein